MKNSGLLFFSLLLVLIAAIALACGSPSRLAQSVTVSPATADAQDFAGGLVQFTATGYYNQEPSPVTPLTATWGGCSLNVSVNAAGLAQCSQGATGTYKVWALVQNPWHGVCTLDVVCGGEGCGAVVGNAELTCP